jgi:hypothetical protein
LCNWRFDIMIEKNYFFFPFAGAFAAFAAS